MSDVNRDSSDESVLFSSAWSRAPDKKGIEDNSMIIVLISP